MPDAAEGTHGKGAGWSAALRGSSSAGCLARGSVAAAPARGARSQLRASVVETEALAKAIPATEERRELTDEELFANDGDAKTVYFNARDQVGIFEPFGYFDPLGYCPDDDRDKFRFLRASEIKHGRVAMLASVGAVVAHFIRIPGYERARGSLLSEWDSAFGYPTILLTTTTICVMFWMELTFWAQREDKEPGDFGDPLNFNMYNEDMRNKEINNGRAAMFAALGIWAAQAATDKDAMQQFGFF
mmetsp:Transcript_24768/g.65440  ORF Transcript_24768/g.65440 Transcript_24768/m.65440 type:complete len:245 (+) Transcript_24768:3-737(+)